MANLTKKNKYSWTRVPFDMWLKKQAEQLRKAGFRADTASVSQILHEKVLIPNNVQLTDLIKPKIKIKKKIRL